MIGLALATLMGESNAVLPLATIAGLIVGIIGILLTKPVLIVTTGAGGGMSMGLALGGLMENAGMGTVAGVVLAIAGIFVQFYFDRKTGGNEDAVTASGTFAANHAPASGYKVGSWAVIKTLTRNNLTSQQAICGAIVYGLMGFALCGCGLTMASGFMGVLLTLFIILFFAALGAAVGACWDKGGREFFHMDEADFKNRKTAYGAAIGAAVGVVADLFMAPLVHGHFGICACIFCTCFLYGAAMGYVMGLRSRYQATYGESPNAFRIPAGASPAAPGRAAPSAPFQAASPATAVPPPSAAPAVSQDALVKNSSRLWTQGLPIIVTETSIVPRPENPDLVSLSLAFQNLHDQAVIAVYFGVKCFNRLNQELEPLEKLTVQDFSLESGGFWSCPRPYALPDSDTRRVELVVRHVLMADGSTWDCEEGQTLTAVEEQPPLRLKPVLANQFYLACAGLTRAGYDPQRIFRYQPQEFESHWNCACGQLNLGGSCLACGIDRQGLFERVNEEYLEERCRLQMEEQARLIEEQRREAEERRQAEERLRAERQQKIEAQKQAVLEKATKVKDWANKTWTEKIWPHRKKIAISLCAVVVIAISAFAVRQYQIRAEAERLRVEQELEAQRIAEEQAEAERRRAAEEQAEAERRKAEEEAQRQAAIQAAIQAEFDQIIADAQSKSYATEDMSRDGYPDRVSGTCYIDYIDFNGDGQEELVVGRVSNSCWVEYGGSTAEFRLAVYGGAPHEVVAWDDTRYELGKDIEERVISLVKCGREMYIKIYEVEGSRISGA